jgi:signal transduction histidine kinase/ActR/RegA family two-component response regulator
LQQERFRELPFVKEEPHSRFYAGTPLTTDDGINIGCLFVLDNKPREGLSEIERNALGTAAVMVMNYLQVSRQAIEGRRASRLSKGLRLFVDGKSSFADSSNMSRSISANSSRSSRASEASASRGTSRSTTARQSDFDPPSSYAEISDAGLQKVNLRSLSPSSSGSMNRDIATEATSLPHLSPADNSSVSSTSNEWIFQRAANLLRQSLDLDGAGGVMFSKISGYSPDCMGGSRRNSTDSNAGAPVLALSTRDDPLFYQTISKESSPAVNMDNDFISQLTSRYPKGRLWSFHSDGTLTTSDEEQSLSRSRKQRKRSRASETRKLNEYFPDACQVMFVPLWNATNSQWFAGCFCWTPQPTRIFSRAVDLSSTFGFASSLMTEYSRVESVIADRQKGDFISSISHELRSPLHGVLAAVELLGDTDLDEFQDSLIETINACGRTLLDTMNQVLDFSKIMSMERRKRRLGRRKDPWRRKSSDEIPARMDPFVSTDLATLTEDVVDSVCLGHSHIQRSSTSTNHSPTLHSRDAREEDDAGADPKVEVVVKISKNDWLYKLQPGSLRRLIMNLLGNSLKYTKEGLVTVCIDVSQRPKGHSQPQELEDIINLAVSDTGRGISSEYLRSRLYTPFAQEDTLSVGTGLGLSIVRGIVDTLKGTINIDSQVGKGTIVKVSFPLERPGEKESLPSTLPVEELAQKTHKAASPLCQMKFQGKRAAIWGIDSSPPSEHQFWSSIVQYATDWFGLQVVPWSANETVDVLFADERDMSEERLRHFPITLPRLLLFCNDSSSSGSSRAKWSHLADCLVIIRRPCGPQRLARGISSCLNSTSAPAGLRGLGHEQDFVIPERPKPTNPSPSAETPNTSSPGHLPSSAIESTSSRPRPCTCGSFFASRDVPKLLPDTELSGVGSPNAALNDHALPTISSSSGMGHIAELPSTRQNRPRVLLVDDNEINMRLLLTFMKHQKVTDVDTADNGRAAVDYVERNVHGYDLIFMDISMPIMDGIEATRAIRALEREREGCVSAKIVAFTGLSSLRDETNALDAGVNLFLTKPVSFKEVSRLINEWETISN